MKRTLPSPDNRLPGPTQPPTEPPAGRPLPQPPEQQTFEERFVPIAPIGEGGMGRVWRYFDKVLDRTVAVKILPPDAAGQAALVEARIAARLQHPGITAVYEIGALPDGDQWLVMRELSGVDFDDLLRAADAHPEPGALRRLLTVLHKVCEAMAYAHEQGTVHRDLKPANIRVGDFGEVVVLDWGIAGAVGDSPPVAGTEGFMSVEQRAGAPLDPRMDVYALGLLLARALNGRTTPETTQLQALAEQATRTAADARPATAAAMARALGAWLDGADAREDAHRLIEEAKALLPQIATLREKAAALDGQAADVLDRLPAHAPTDQKASAWAKQDEAQRLEQQARAHEVTYESRLDEARRRSAEVAEARHLLAALYRDRVVEAERSRDAREAATYTARLTEVDHERVYTEFLAGLGALTLVTDPPGAEVWAGRYVERGRRLVIEEETRLGTTPLRKHALERGSWRIRLTHPGYQDVIYPVLIERDDHWDGIPPGETEPLPITLPRVGELDDDEVYVPAGWFWAGGDRLAGDALPRRRIWVDGYAIGRFPLTYGDLVDDLDALWQRGEVDQARALAKSAGRLGALQVEETPSGIVLRARNPAVPVLDWPVSQVSWRSSRAWLAWRAEVSGRPLRLPHSLEWEKAARGADGRAFPWGDHFEVTWANVLNCSAEPPQLRAVGTYPIDESPHGVCGIAGNVRDYCLDPYRRNGLPADIRRLQVNPNVAPATYYECRGGAWASRDALCRSAGRFAAPPDGLSAQTGVRQLRPFGMR